MRKFSGFSTGSPSDAKTDLLSFRDGRLDTGRPSFAAPVRAERLLCSENGALVRSEMQFLGRKNAGQGENCQKREKRLQEKFSCNIMSLSKFAFAGRRGAICDPGPYVHGVFCGRGDDGMRESAGRNVWRVLLCVLAVVCAVSGIAPLSVHAADRSENLRTVRVGYYNMSNFQEYDAGTGTYRGYSYDYMQAIAQYAGWSYEFVPVTYSEGLRMLENGELDLMNNVQITEELSRHLSYSSLPSGTSCTCLVVSPSNADVAYEDFQSIGSLTVGLDYSSGLNSGFVDYCKDNDCMPALLYYHTAAGVDRGLRSGEINAYIVSDLQDVAMRTVAKFDTQSYYFATTKGNSSLLQELNSAMNSLKTSDPYFEEKIYAKYHGKSSEEQTVISSVEKAFVAQNEAVKVAFFPSWYPISYADKDGNFQGAMSSVFQFISNRTGLKFEYVSSKTAADALKLFRSGEVQVLAGFPYDYTWAVQNNARITTPFTTLTVFAAYRASDGSGSVYAVPSGSYLRYLTESVRQDGLSYREYASTDECLQAVIGGEADFAFLDSYQLEYYRERANYRKLAFKVLNGDDYGLSIAVSTSADERIYTIISKALSSASTDEIGNILRETTIGAASRTLIDTLYANPRTAGILLVLFGFLLAVMISSLIYTRAISRKNMELKAATNAKSTFLSNMSHDMRTPLNGIIGYTELALKTEAPAEREDYLEKIRISGQFLLSLINDTLDISKIESGKFALKPEPVEVAGLLESIVVPIRQTAEAKGISFRVDTGRMRGGYIFADRLNVQKIILNLLSNAVKFTPEGGEVSLTIVSLVPPREGKNTQITVEDNGIGIGKDFLQVMFEPFSQERAPESGAVIGTGLGLSIVKSIVEKMGGKIEAASSKGSGTRFDVFLPFSYLENYQPDTRETAGDADALRGLTALLCEDHYMNREIALKVLQSFGMEVVCAENGRQGVELFAASPPGRFSVVLMDLRMPVLDGFGATAAIRALQREDAGVPILAMSADAYDDDLEKCRAVGMNGHVPKPIDTKLLFSELVRVCGKRRG